MGNKGSLFLVGILALLGGMLAGYFLLQTDAPDSTDFLTMELEDLTGRRQNLNQWQNKVVIINFWATWCVPCREEIPALNKLQSAYASREVQFIGIAIDEKNKVESFIKEMPINYLVLLGGIKAIELSKKAGNKVGGLPFTLILDRSGKISFTRLGLIDPSQLATIIQKLL